MDLFPRNSFAHGREALPQGAVLLSEASHLSISKKGRPTFRAASSGSLLSLLKGTMKKCNSFRSTSKNEQTLGFKKDGDVGFQSDSVFLSGSEEASTISKKNLHTSLNVKSKHSKSTGNLLSALAMSAASRSQQLAETFLSPSLSSNGLNLISRKMRSVSANDLPLGESLVGDGKSGKTKLPCTENTQASPKQQKKGRSRLFFRATKKGSTGTLQALTGESSSFGSLKCCLKKQLSANDICPAELEDAHIGLAFDEDDDVDVCISCFSSIPKSVTFDVVEVREYVPSISHNPMVKDGYAVELGWDYSGAITLDVNKFEDSRPPVVRTNQDLRLDSVERLKILRASGHDLKAIRRAREATLKGLNQRSETLKNTRAEDRKEEAKWEARNGLDRTRQNTKTVK
jgi:hypothetical protein